MYDSPLLVGLGAVVVGNALDELLPFEALETLGGQLRMAIAAVVVLLGVWFIVAGRLALRRSRRALAETGIYANTRNPGVQGWLIIWLGVALITRSNWAVVMLVPAAWLLRAGVRREERLLGDAFGQPYRAYCRNVPRYGLPFASTSATFMAVAMATIMLLVALAWAVWPRDAVWRIRPHQIVPTKAPNYTYPVPLPLLHPLARVVSDTPGALRQSDLRLFENGQPLGPPHTQPPRLDLGQGVYLHWNGTLMFSASDNSNPRVNRRVYEARGWIQPNPLAVGTAVVLIIAAAASLLAHMRRRMTGPRPAG